MQVSVNSAIQEQKEKTRQCAASQLLFTPVHVYIKKKNGVCRFNLQGNYEKIFMFTHFSNNLIHLSLES